MAGGPPRLSIGLLQTSAFQLFTPKVWPFSTPTSLFTTSPLFTRTLARTLLNLSLPHFFPADFFLLPPPTSSYPLVEDLSELHPQKTLQSSLSPHSIKLSTPPPPLIPFRFPLSRPRLSFSFLFPSFSPSLSPSQYFPFLLQLHIPPTLLTFSLLPSPLFLPLNVDAALRCSQGRER